MIMTALGYQTKLLHIVKKNLQTLTSLCKKLQQNSKNKTPRNKALIKVFVRLVFKACWNGKPLIGETTGFIIGGKILDIVQHE